MGDATGVRGALEPAWFRFRVTFRHRRGGYLAIVLLLGLVGGVALGSLAGARRTQSSYPVYLASTKPADLQVFTAFLNPALGPAETQGYLPSSERRLAALPYVESQQTVVGFDANIDQILGARVRVGAGAKPASLEGPVEGEYFTQDRVTLVSGRLPDPANPGEAMMNAQAGRELGIHVGSTITVTLNSDAQLLSPADNPPDVARAPLHIVGLAVFPADVLNDDYDAAGTAEVLTTPALTRRIDACCATYSYSSLRVVPGHIGDVESELSRVLPSQLLRAVGFRTGAPAVGLAERAIEPESIALAVFGALTALAALVIVSQIIGRQQRNQATEFETLRALGAGPSATAADAVTGPVAAVGVGAGLASVVAFLISPLFPLGPVRPVYPYSYGWDWTVLGLGSLALMLVLSIVAVGMALRRAPARVQRQRQLASRPSAAARVAGSLALPAPAMSGVRFALEPGAPADAVPVRSAILGASLAILVVVATVIFGTSLNSLIGRPALYGWNWNYAL
ncbi:MAG TPA: FtsX-like permease family protein, partial [Acidimicrobiales bacterium]|nr:FtsX-like permease family protein [Acidimicrobiales bacterium]